jgi:hypothetical protein
MEDHKKSLDELNKQSLKKFEEFLKNRSDLKEGQHEKITQAKKEWQEAWQKLVDVATVLDSFEI